MKTEIDQLTLIVWLSLAAGGCFVIITLTPLHTSHPRST